MKNIFFIFIAGLLISFAQKGTKPEYDMKFIEKNLAYIPKTTFVMGHTDSDIPDDSYTRTKTVSVESFYMFNQEVSNGLYVYYLKQLKSSGQTDAYSKALPDTNIWKTPFGYNEPYIQYYLRHPAYAGYPVVGITYAQCQDFCSWLTKVYNAWEPRKFKKVVFDLPDTAQRECATKGGLTNAIFPWEGPYMQNKKGEWMANFYAIDQASVARLQVEQTSIYGNKYIATYNVGWRGGDYTGVAGKLSDNADVTAPVISYWPNAFKLYNMAGNVEEFVKPYGKTMGGSWKDPGYYLQNHVHETYTDSTEKSVERGFRFIMKVIE